MQEALRLTTFAFVLASASLSAFAQGEIPWRHNLPEARHIASQEQRLLLIHFYSDNCPPCRKLDKVVFTNLDVHRAMAANYVPVKINADRSRDLAAQFQVDRWPTDVIADQQGRILYKTVSPQDPGRYVQLLNAVAADFRAGSPPMQVANRGAPPPAAPHAGAAPPMDFAGPNSGPPLSHEQINPYAGHQADTSAAHGAQHSTAYDPRSSWAPPTPAGGAPGYAPAAPAPPPAHVRAPVGPGWQENRFVTNRMEADVPAPAAVPGATPAMMDGLDGYCPVTLQEQERWVRGDARWGAVHRGCTYLFLSQDHQQRFLSNPDHYSPVLSGLDPARYVDRGELVPGRRAHGMWFRGKVYLFADEQSLDRFSQSPDFYAQRSYEIMMTAGR